MANELNPYESPMRVAAAATASIMQRPALWQPVLWRMFWREQRLLLIALCVLLFVFGAIYVWLMSLVKLEGMTPILRQIFGMFEKMSGVPFEDVTTVQGRIALGFVDPVVLLTMTVFSITRGSDFVSGELDRGTMELILAQPIRRMSFFWAKVTNNLLGVFALAISFWLGISLGIQLVHPQDPVSGWDFWPGVTNIICLGVMISGVATAMSSWDRFRWRTIGIMGGCYATWLLLKILFKMGGESFRWVGWITPFRWFEPQLLIKQAHDTAMIWQYNSLLLLIGTVGFVIAAVVYCRRDLPAPL
jgi:ABC-2 type transport system permease protein